MVIVTAMMMGLEQLLYVGMAQLFRQAIVNLL